MSFYIFLFVALYFTTYHIKNLKKALNGNYKDRNAPVKNRIIQEPEYQEDKEAEEVLRKLGF